VPGQSGTITVDHLGRYGEVTGKAVALEPATGFSFDTPLVPKVY
jgi:multidrug resistance efflux pump